MRTMTAAVAAETMENGPRPAGGQVKASRDIATGAISRGPG